MLVSFDTNILLYAHDSKDVLKHAAAKTILRRLSGRGLPLAGQVISEFLAVNRRKHFVSHPDAVEIAAILGSVFDLVELDTILRVKAANLSETAHINFYDALILVAAAKGGATHLLSEDMADGQQLAGVQVVNPFDPGNAVAVGELLG